MSYRAITAQVQIGDDSNLFQREFDRTASVSQIKDLQTFTTNVRVVPGAPVPWTGPQDRLL